MVLQYVANGIRVFMVFDGRRLPGKNGTDAAQLKKRCAAQAQVDAAVERAERARARDHVARRRVVGVVGREERRARERAVPARVRHVRGAPRGELGGQFVQTLGPSEPPRRERR